MKNTVPSKWAGKFALFMKISTFFLTFIWSVPFAFASGTIHGQEVLKKNVTVNFDGVYVGKALNELAAAAGVKFTYSGAVTNSKTKVSASATNQQLGKVLNSVLASTSFTFEVVDDEVLIVPVTKKKTANHPPQRILTGKVIDEKGLPLPGVSVRIKGTNRGGITDLKGVYQIQINDPADILVFTFVGYKPNQATAGQNETLDVQMVPLPASELKEVAVVAYGTQRKISLVGAQSTVNVEELKNAPVASLSTLLAGRVAGIIGVQRSGQPGGDGSNIWIRGIASFNTSGPLILVDGVDRGTMDNLDPLDIQSFTILKDASATAVYGVRGANGVILIITKRGVAGRPQINTDFYEGIQTFTQQPQMADAASYLAAVNEANTTRGNAFRNLYTKYDK
jgi:TonB-dependent SusC/RagA subfamily outer membrane receptor